MRVDLKARPHKVSTCYGAIEVVAIIIIIIIMRMAPFNRLRIDTPL